MTIFFEKLTLLDYRKRKFDLIFFSGKGLICCGDDKGSLWLYNLPQFGKDSPTPALKTKIDVTTRLMWPELQVDMYKVLLKKG